MILLLYVFVLLYFRHIPYMDKAVTLLLTWLGLAVCAQLAHLGHGKPIKGRRMSTLRRDRTNGN